MKTSITKINKQSSINNRKRRIMNKLSSSVATCTQSTVSLFIDFVMNSIHIKLFRLRIIILERNANSLLIAMSYSNEHIALFLIHTDSAKCCLDYSGNINLYYSANIILDNYIQLNTNLS